METGTPSTPPSGPRPRALFGARRPAMRAVVALVIVAVLGLGGYRVYDRYYLTPKREREIETGEYTRKRYQRWKRKGERGWECLFVEAKMGYPGYSVDIGRPPRLVLAEVGADLKPFLDEKLRTADFPGRMTTIQLLGAIGEPTPRIVELLEKELAATSERHEEIAVLNCAKVVPEGAIALMQLSFAALESPNAKTRYRATGNLVDLASKDGAPQELIDRVNDLRTNGDVATRVDFAVARSQRDLRAAYETLLEGLASDDEKGFAVAAGHTARLRDADTLSETMTPEERAAVVADHRTFLNMELVVLDMHEALQADHVPREAYELLLRMLDHDDVQIVDSASGHVAELRGEGFLKYDTPPEQRLKFIEAHRAWLTSQLAEEEEATSDETTETETGEDAVDEPSGDEPSGDDPSTDEGVETDERPAEESTEGEDETEPDPEKVEAEFRARVVSEAVVCDECGETTEGLEIPFSDCRRFHTCPKCGKKTARPIVYYVCLNPDCNKALVKVRNHVFEHTTFFASEDAMACPACGRHDMISPNELSMEAAKKVAEETSQELP